MDITLTLESAPTSKPVGDNILYECRPKVDFSQYPIVCDISAAQYDQMLSDWNTQGAGVKFNAKIIKTKLKANKTHVPNPAEWDYYYRAQSVSGIVDEYAMGLPDIGTTAPHVAPSTPVQAAPQPVAAGPHTPSSREMQIIRQSNLKAAAEVTVPFAKALCEAMMRDVDPKTKDTVQYVELQDLSIRFSEHGAEVTGLISDFMMNVCDNLMRYTLTESKEVSE